LSNHKRTNTIYIASRINSTILNKPLKIVKKLRLSEEDKVNFFQLKRWIGDLGSGIYTKHLSVGVMLLLTTCKDFSTRVFKNKLGFNI